MGMVTVFNVDRHRWKRLSRMAYARSRWSRVGVLLATVSGVSYDVEWGLFTLAGKIWHGLKSDVSNGMGLAPETFVLEPYVVIPNCFQPDLLEFLLQYVRRS